MKKTFIIRFFLIFIIGISLVLFNSCKKDSDDDSDNKKIVFNPDKTYGTVTDITGNVYKTITIGTQTWMAENLKTAKYANGDSIKHITNDEQWRTTTQGAWTYYGNDDKLDTDYGKLYNWLAVEDPRNICPAGWHIPNDPEWETLLLHLGGYLVAGVKMKETGLNHFADSNEGATNESGFTGLPGGMKDYGSWSFDLGLSGFWWSSTNANDYYDRDAYYYYLSRDMDAVLDGTGDKNNGASCRCIKD